MTYLIGKIGKRMEIIDIESCFSASDGWTFNHALTKDKKSVIWRAKEAPPSKVMDLRFFDKTLTPPEIQKIFYKWTHWDEADVSL